MTPIILKTKYLEDLRVEVAQLLPAALKDLLKTFLPRLSGAAETALATLNVIPTFNMLSFPASPLTIEDLAQDKRVEKIYLDRMMYALKVPEIGIYTDPTTKRRFTTTYWTKRLLGLDQANAEGWTGKGITVAAINTGSTKLHEQTPHVEIRSTMTGMYSDATGHGQWVISAIGGRPAQDTFLRVFVEGMAPDARLLSIKALGYVIGVGKESDVLQAMELAIKQGADVVNLSLGSEQVTEKPEDDPEVLAIEKMTREYKMLVCVAAGNSGPSEGTVNSPGVAPDALTVGAWDEINGGVPPFSSKGPSPWGEIKPDFVMPGVNVDSACVGLLDVQGDRKSQRYSYLSGSSMATPHLSGLLACAREKVLKETGTILTAGMVKDVGEKLGEPKNVTSGYGLLTWSMMEEYLKAYLP